MEKDTYIEYFFEICRLDSKNFSFDELIKSYKFWLSLIIDQEDSNYLDVDVLNFAVMMFSKIIKSCFLFEETDNVKLQNFCEKSFVE